MTKEKTIIRVNKKANFVVISRFPLEDERLTWEARGLYSFLLAKPDNWQISLTHLTRSSPAGRDKNRRILNELVGFKYICKNEIRTTSGQFSYPEYIIYELPYDGHFEKSDLPATENPSAVDPSVVLPVPENPPLINKQSNKQTTTTNIDLDWPKKLSKADRQSILKISNNTEPVVVQLLLDELSGQLPNVSNSVGYFRSLLKRYMNDEFVPAVSNKTQADRLTRLANNQALINAEKNAKLRFQSMLKKYEGKSDG